MNDSGIVETLCKLPFNHHAGTKSMAQLVTESGVRSRPDVLSVEQISAYLSRHPELIEHWFLWSGDKRVSSGWFVVERPEGYLVGYHPRGERLVFTDKTLACAEFIVREVRDIVSRLKS